MFFTPVKEDIPIVFPDLPDLARLAHEDTAWRYPSSCAGGYGIARLRVYQADSATAPTSDGGTCIAAVVAVVSETGKRVTVTNAAEEIWQLLWDMYGPRLILVEHWPADQLGDGREDTWDQVVVVGGRARWRRIWPLAPENPDHEAMRAWMQRTRWLT
ncbi:hypothetical protein [Microbispora sp. NBRC 16548]|uniref:hypothetical protein n=1 Tax=Microbispora sp. NBRC 16548 TaxID=3030994 RepID=UPI0024A4DE6F|nr:hypothetical protein [Microbispora sp. NBRC 16548]GLX06774.1 hypothetical protein Misp03_37010 [Microbispora sp. NBRC 16548]